MRLYTLLYWEELDHGDFTTEKYNLISLHMTEEEAQTMKKKVAFEKQIVEEKLYVSVADLGDAKQWRGGFFVV